MTTKGKLSQTNLNFLSSGTNVLTLTATSDGLATFSSNAGNVRLTGLAEPSGNSDAASKAYVDSIATAGATWKNSVRVATTVTGVLATDFENGDTVDGIVLATNDRVLIKDQSTASENGIYIINATGAPTRSDDFLSGNNAAGVAIWINEGTSNGDKGYICTNDTGSDVVGTDALTFTNFSSAPGVAGSDTQVQFNNNGLFSGSSDFTWDGISLQLSDSKNFTVGSSDDLVITHNGTDSVVTSTTGNLQFDNTNVTGSTVFTMGTDTSATSFVVENDSATDIFSIDGAGLATFNTGSTVSHLDSVTSNWGTSSDLSIVHDGTDSIVTSTTGELKIVNSNATGNTVFKMGDAAAATSVKFTGSDDAAVMTIGSDDSVDSTSTTTGAVKIVGGLGVTLDIYCNEMNTISDATLKTNINRFNEPLDKLNKIEGYTYEWKKDNGNGRTRWGVLAQQLEEIGLGEAVNNGEDHKSVNYLMLIPLMIEALKELKNDTDFKFNQLKGIN